MDKLAEHRVVLIKADYTERDLKIGEELKKYGGVVLPISVVLPAGVEGEPIILPELITPEIAIEALDRAAGR